MLRNRQSVAPCAASSSSFSCAGIGVRPSARVRMTVCESSGSVSSRPRAAAAAVKDDTPGTIWYSIPSVFMRRICSAVDPKRTGSPVCTRATSWPASRAATMTARISFSVTLDESRTRASGLAVATTSFGTSEPV